MQPVTKTHISQEHKVEKNLAVTWNQFEVHCINLGIDIELSGWKPKAIIGIGRGGWEVAAALSRYFKVPSGAFMCKSYEAEGACVGVKLKSADGVTFIGELEGPVLIADDLADKGHTLKHTYEFIKEMYKIEDVKTAVIFCKTKTEYTPDYYVEMVDAGTWIFLPNEIYERVDISKLSRENKIKLSENPELIRRLLDFLPENPRKKMSLEAASTLINL